MNIYSPRRFIEKLLGNEEHFTLAQQLFHAITFCIACAALLMGISDTLLHLGPQYYYYSFSISGAATLLYIASRRGTNFRNVIVPYYLISGATLIYVWKMLGGFSGSFLLISLALTITIPMISTRNVKRGALISQQVLIGVLYSLEPAPSPATTDQVVTTIILSMGCYMGISFMMKNYNFQKQKLLQLNDQKTVANHQLINRTKDLEAAIARIRELNQLLPICCNCNKIRDDQGYWLQLEHYFSEHRDTTFSHGICPECADQLYGKYCDPEETTPQSKNSAEIP